MPSEEKLRGATAELIVDLRLFTTNDGGKEHPIRLGWGCPCLLQKDLAEGYDGWPLLGDNILNPGDSATVGFVFLSGEEAASKFRSAGKFYLWEGRLIGEATVVQNELEP